MLKLSNNLRAYLIRMNGQREDGLFWNISKTDVTYYRIARKLGLVEPITTFGAKLTECGKQALDNTEQ